MVKNRQGDVNFLRRHKTAVVSRLMSFLAPFMVWNTVGYAESPILGQPEKLEVIRTIPHTGYSEGLDFHDGYLWHSVKETAIRKIDPKDGSIVATYIPPGEWPESLVWVNGALIQVVFRDKGIYQGKLNANGKELKFKRVGETPEVEGWGIVYDGKNIVVTGSYDSKNLYFLNPKTFKLVRKITTDVKNLEDLAWDGKWLWTSSFTEHSGQIFPVDPKTGKISKFFQLPQPDECPVIDGIAIDKETLWITGKNCLSIYQVKLPKVR